MSSPPTEETVERTPGELAAAPIRGTERSSFIKLWFGFGVSQLGTAVTAVALPLLAVLQLHAGALQVGILNAAQYAAYGVLGLAAGIYVDRRSRRNVMLVTDAARAALLAAVPILWAADLLRLWHLYVVAFGVSVLTLLFEVAFQAFFPVIVSRDRLIAGNARLQATSSITELAGPGIAGVLVQALGAAVTLLIDAFSYLVSFASVLAIRGMPETHLAADRADGGAPRRSIKSQIGEGIRYFRRDPVLASFFGCVAQFNFFIVAEEALFVVFLVKSVHAAPGLIGVLLAGTGVGAILGAMLAQRLARRFGVGWAMLLGATVGPLLGLLIPLTHKNVTLLCFVVGTAGLGAGTTILRVVGGSYRQATVPAHLLGRIVSIMRTLTWGPLPLGALLGGVLGQELGPRAALLCLSLLMLASPLWLLGAPVRKLSADFDGE